MESLYNELVNRQKFLRDLAVKFSAGAITKEEMPITPDAVGKELDLINAYLFQLDVQREYTANRITANA